MMWQKWCEYKISYLRDVQCFCYCRLLHANYFVRPATVVRFAFGFPFSYARSVYFVVFFFFLRSFFYAIQFCTRPTFQSSIIEMERWSAHIYLRSMNCMYVWALKYLLDAVCAITLYSMEQQTILWAKPCVAHTKIVSFVLIFIFFFSSSLLCVQCVAAVGFNCLYLNWFRFVRVFLSNVTRLNLHQSYSSQLSCYVHSIDRIKSESFLYAQCCYCCCYFD